MRAVGERPSAKVADTGRMWTKSIWDHVPWDQIQAGQREGQVFFDDFTNVPTLDEADATDTLYASYGDAGADIRQGAANEHGEIILSTDGGDNEEAWITTGGNVGGMAEFILQATAVPHLIAFECRVKIATLANNNMYVGFAQEGMAAADALFSDANVIANKSYLGFLTVVHATAPTVNIQYAKVGGTDANILADAHTWVADTYVKLGLLYDYRHPDAQQIKFFVNGVVQTSYGTKAIIDDTTNFPGNDEMALLFGGKEGAAAAHAWTMDWWRFAQVVLG